MLGVPGHRGPHLRRAARAADLGLPDLAGLARSTRSASACPRRSRTTRGESLLRGVPGRDRAAGDRWGRGEPRHGHGRGGGARHARHARRRRGGVLARWRRRRSTWWPSRRARSELNISVVVAAKHAAEAQRRIHTAFQLSRIAGGSVIRPERMELVLLGFGQIGRALAALIGQVAPARARLQVAAVIDRSGFVFDPQGISPRRLAALAAEKRKGRPLADAAARARGHAPRRRSAHRRIRADPAGAGGPDGRRHGARPGAGARPTAWISCSPTSGRWRAGAP